MFSDLMLQAATANLPDENGWPLSDSNDRVSYQLHNSIPLDEDAIFDVTYKCKNPLAALDGSGFVTGTATQDGKGTWSGKIKIRKGSSLFGLGIKNTGGGCTDIHVYREGADRSKTYNPKYINFIKGYDTYRFMELTATNNSGQAKWADRNWPNRPMQGRKNGKLGTTVHTGLAWEHIVEFANETRGNIWINVPIMADDDYVRNLAKLLKEGLKYGQAIYIEYGNENWNGGMFDQQARLSDIATKEIATGKSNLNPPGTGWPQWARYLSTRRSREIAILFGEVFGEAALNKQVRVVLGGWGGVPDYNNDILSFLNRTYPSTPVNKYIYGIATGSYIGDDAVNGKSLSNFKSREEVFPWMEQAILNSTSTKSYTAYKALADQYQIKNMIYEGGIDLIRIQSGLRAKTHPLSIARSTTGEFLTADRNAYEYIYSLDLPATNTQRVCLTVDKFNGKELYEVDGLKKCAPTPRGLPDIKPGTGITVSAHDFPLMKQDPRYGNLVKGMLNKWFADTDNSLFVWYKADVGGTVWYYSDTIDDDESIAQRALRSYTNYTPPSKTKPAPRKTVFDFNGDGTADIFWRFTGSVSDQSTGNLRLFRINNARVLANLPIYRSNDKTKPVFIADQNWQVAATADFNGDGKTDVLWRNNQTGGNLLYAMNDNVITSEQVVTTMPIEWKLEGAGDVDGDGKADILWRNSLTGATRLDRMNGATTLSTTTLKTVSTDWKMIAMRDVNGDGKSDLIWHNPSTGEVKIDLLNGSQITSSTIVGSKPAPWALEAVGDFDGDGKTDIFWRNTNIDQKLDAKAGTMCFWFMDGAKIARETALREDYVEYNSAVHTIPDWAPIRMPANQYRLELAADLDGDGKADFMWYDTTSKNTKIRLMNGNTVTLEYTMSGEYDPAWKITNH